MSNDSPSPAAAAALAKQHLPWLEQSERSVFALWAVCPQVIENLPKPTGGPLVRQIRGRWHVVASAQERKAICPIGCDIIGAADMMRLARQLVPEGWQLSIQSVSPGRPPPPPRSR